MRKWHTLVSVTILSYSRLAHDSKHLIQIWDENVWVSLKFARLVKLGGSIKKQTYWQTCLPKSSRMAGFETGSSVLPLLLDSHKCSIIPSHSSQSKQPALGGRKNWDLTEKEQGGQRLSGNSWICHHCSLCLALPLMCLSRQCQVKTFH